MHPQLVVALRYVSTSCTYRCNLHCPVIYCIVALPVSVLPHYLRSHTYILYRVARLKDGWLACCAASHMYHSRSLPIAPTESIQLSCDMLNYVRKLPSRSVLRMLDNSPLSDERRRTPRCRNAASKYSFLRSQPQNSLFRPSFVGSHVVPLDFKSRC